MRPTASEQLAGLADILATIVVPEVDGDYPLDIANGTIANIQMLADALDEVGPFLLWDIERSRAVLALVGADVADVEVPAFDLPALRARHVEVRGALESAVDLVRADPTANAAMVDYIRARAGRYPFVARYRGGSLARTAR